MNVVSLVSFSCSLVNIFFNGQISDFANILFLSANLTAIMKKYGGLHPIAVGNILRRLASKSPANLLLTMSQIF